MTKLFCVVVGSVFMLLGLCLAGIAAVGRQQQSAPRAQYTVTCGRRVWAAASVLPYDSALRIELAGTGAIVFVTGSCVAEPIFSDKK